MTQALRLENAAAPKRPRGTVQFAVYELEEAISTVSWALPQACGPKG